MDTASNNGHDFDLLLTRVVNVPRQLLWRGWTEAELLKRWFAPLPWTTPECTVDLRPGGLFRTVMRSPERQDYVNDGCYLAVENNSRLVWTDTLAAGFRPSVKPFFTAVLTFEDAGSGTRYTARALHKDEADRQTHEDMGFHTGWAQSLDQLVTLAHELK